jgi:isopentenyl-diphosphate delta-isomerase
MSTEMMILVDEHDNPIGEMEKMEAHRKGLLHRAFSGFAFNDRRELLIQRRALGKYHNPGIWANTVCSHPRKGESAADAARRRAREELGFEADFADIGNFIYRAEFPNGLTEHELDHVCVAAYGGQEIRPNPDEVCDWRWIARGALESEIAGAPEKFSYWLREILARGIVDGWF